MVEGGGGGGGGRGGEGGREGRRERRGRGRKLSRVNYKHNEIMPVVKGIYNDKIKGSTLVSQNHPPVAEVGLAAIAWCSQWSL